ncbi:MAG: hypothetical protein NT148_02295, partial [Candidatus Nealsonbacteria bacterium]|nr:hypothetical protein [Candidatus Nealsonbacteria bacterium]
MLFLNHEYNKDNYITQREATWDFINEKLELKELSKKSNYNFKMKLDELSGFEIKKADDWLSRLTEIFMQLTYDLSEIVLANRLAREDNEKKAYFLFNFRYYFTNLTNGIYTFWNMVAQYFNVLYSGQNNEPNKRKWEEEEEKIDCGFFKADVITKRESLQPMLELY